MSRAAQIQKLLSECTPAQREEVFRQLRLEFPIHPLETQLHTKAEIILEAIQRAGGLTLRMITGVIAEAAFEVEVVERLKGWKRIPRAGDLAYDFLLKDKKGEVRVQVKLQRSKAGIPWPAHLARRAWRSLPTDMFVVETQKTRAGKARGSAGSTRPYRFGEFDVLAVSLYPATKRWGSFMFTLADWLVPDPKDAAQIFKYQPVAAKPNDDWTDRFQTAETWFRSRIKKTIRSE
jgi:hypothetical protein